MFKKIVQKLIQLYIAPIHLNHKLAIYTKGRLLRNMEEHILCAVDYIYLHSDYSSEDIIVDAGVYNGSTVSLFARSFPENKIFGFEPNPVKYETSKRRFENNSNVLIENKAIGEEDGEAEFHLASTDSASSLNPIAEGQRIQEMKSIPVQTVNLNSYFPKTKYALILKLDIEGFELNVLQSSSSFLSRTKYVITEMNNNEYHTGGSKYYQVDELLRKSGFKLVIISSDYNNNGLDQYDAVYENTSLAGNKANG